MPSPEPTTFPPTTDGPAPGATPAPDGERAWAEPRDPRLVYMPPLSRRLIRGVLSVVVGGLVLASLGLDLVAAVGPGDWQPRGVWFFDLDTERNLPTWYQTVMLAVCGLLLAMIARQAYARWGSMRIATPWLLLGGIFMALSMDEMISLHERTIVPLQDRFGIEGGPLYFAWIIPAAVALVALGIMFLPFLRSLAHPVRLRFVVAGALYIGGAIGMEMIGGTIAGAEGTSVLSYNLVTTVEEALEMAGVVVFLDTLLGVLGTWSRPVVRLDQPGERLGR